MKGEPTVQGMQLDGLQGESALLHSVFFLLLYYHFFYESKAVLDLHVDSVSKGRRYSLVSLSLCLAALCLCLSVWVFVCLFVCLKHKFVYTSIDTNVKLQQCYAITIFQFRKGTFSLLFRRHTATLSYPQLTLTAGFS